MMTEMNPSYELGPDDAVTPIMVITHDALIWGDLIHKQALMASRALTGVTVPDYINMNNGQRMTVIGGQPSKPVSFPEIYVPVPTILGYHLMPSHTDPLDYDENEPNRIMSPLKAMVGPFFYHASIRISTATNPKVFLDSTKATYMSLYDVEIFLPNSQMRSIQVPHALIKREATIFAI